MTASVFHVTNLTPAGSDNPSKANGQKHPDDDSQYGPIFYQYGPCNQSDTPRE
jgi:hypothetical protein